MAFKFKEVMNKPERLAPGHRLCAGCGASIAVRTVLRIPKSYPLFYISVIWTEIAEPYKKKLRIAWQSECQQQSKQGKE